MRLPGTVVPPPRRSVRIAPRAEYALLEHDERGFRFELRRTTYDVEALLGIALESGMPHAAWWVDSWIESLSKLYK